MNARSAAPLFLLAASCMVGPDYRRPSIAMPSSAALTSSVAKSGVQLSEAPPWDAWWTMFQDDELTALVGDARAENQDLRAAIAHVEVGRALVREAFGPLLPAVSANGLVSYGKQSRNLNPLATGAAHGAFQGTLDAGYELDFWGRTRRGLEAAEGDEAAGEEDRRTVEISVIADTVETYFDLGAAEAALNIAREALDLRRRTVDLVRVRFEAGIAHELDLRRAEGELKAASAEVFESERAREVVEHRLALLIGRTPEVRFRGRPPPAFALPPEIPVGLPSTLLERRPDVRGAEMRLKAANARIGVAYADFFPRVTLVGQFGYASLDAKTLAQSGAQLWSIGPSIYIPIFQGGAIQARWEEMKSRTDEAAAAYRQVVLRAFQEVADALSGIRGHIAQSSDLLDQVTAEVRAVELAETAYRQGLTTYLDVLDAQRTLLGARQALLRAQRNVLADVVSLEKALGGGWQTGER